ncbi:MAG: carbon storage regulator CsrA [Firmicutes bacterium]|jgi:carbon storage regulator|nr:carbon storage regulator CsrA [Bacillota bacterium]
MLVLTRKLGESIMIGGNIKITVVTIDGGAVRLGIEAPANVSVYRQELYEAVRKENLQAIRSALQFKKIPRPGIGRQRK